ncbi:tenascin-like [Sabethes cyaneus]|uniref:tenascin-like n=1 Tax=Sabethes cyaneus TaxID=53552 RepID=UPI00237EB8E7|nr:tenascin-like [Sabethes cyaneus]
MRGNGTCDDGYRPLSNFGCIPNCENCENGICVRPGFCQCMSGYQHAENGSCVVECKDCEFGHCPGPNRCRCHEGTCVCHKGYKEIDGDCFPICEEECRNARCTGPNSCTCLPGYNFTQLSSLFKCLPICQGDCPNGVCVAPETCKCNPGFIKHEKSCMEPLEVCRARCINGTCDKEAKCVCNPGYVLNLTGLCEKTCPEGCVHGKCIDGMCSCNENYRLSLTNSSVCNPICADNCYNGRCVEPNVCQCDVGYTFIDGSRTRCQSIVELQQEKERQRKQQLCLQECRNGVCEQGYCQCKTGYGNPENLNHRCVPLCDPICRNATCVEPDRCECHQGYEFYNDSSSVCFHKDDVRRFQIQLKQDHCEHNCRDGFCEEGKCICPVGFVLSINDEFNCQPFCEKPCLNGVCAGNNRCRCFEGYKNVNDSSTCEPDCEQECLNGHCIGPNECECNSGYVFVEGSKIECEKTLSLIAKEKQEACKAKCKNGICVEGVCKCSEGYYNADKSKMTCEPWCELGCTNGQCVDGGVCVCNEGYELENGHDCKPICTEDCVNGFCRAPERCDCSPGYNRTLDDIMCKPDCGVGGCINGHCVAPDLCECFAGYQQNENDSIKCDLIPEATYKVDNQSNSLMYNETHVKYLIPLAVIATLIMGAIVTMNVLHNLGKLGRTRRSVGVAGREMHVVVVIPTNTKENCVYFMPQPADSTKDNEDRFSV